MHRRSPSRSGTVTAMYTTLLCQTRCAHTLSHALHAIGQGLASLGAHSHRVAAECHVAKSELLATLSREVSARLVYRGPDSPLIWLPKIPNYLLVWFRVLGTNAKNSRL